MAIVQYFLISLVLCFGTSVLFLGPLFFKRESSQSLSPECWHRLWQVLSLAAGFVAGALYAYHGWPAFPPIDSTHWIFWGILPVLGLSGLALYLPDWSRLRLVFRLVLGAVLFYLIYFPILATDPRWPLYIGLAITALIWSLWGWGNESERLTVPNWVNSLNSQLLLVGSLILFLAGSSALLAQLAAIVMVSQFAALLMCRLSRRPLYYPLDLSFFLMAGLWVSALLFSSLNPLAALALLALAFPLVAKAGFSTRLQSWHGWAVALLLSALWLAACVVFAYPTGLNLYYG